MEINKFTDIIGVVTAEAMVEGRMVLLVAHSQSHNFGSRTDLPAVRLPNDSTEAALAKYVVAFALDNRSLPIYQPTPTLTNDFSLRKGFGGEAVNVPFDSSIYLSHPGNMVSQTIPSGSLALAFDRGVFTIPSGQYVYSTDLQAVGKHLVVANATDDSEADAGKLKYSATAGVAIVERWYPENGTLTFRTL